MDASGQRTRSHRGEHIDDDALIVRAKVRKARDPDSQPTDLVAQGSLDRPDPFAALVDISSPFRLAPDESGPGELGPALAHLALGTREGLAG